jgi:hypothetical protein
MESGKFGERVVTRRESPTQVGSVGIRDSRHSYPLPMSRLALITPVSTLIRHTS